MKKIKMEQAEIDKRLEEAEKLFLGYCFEEKKVRVFRRSKDIFTCEECGNQRRRKSRYVRFNPIRTK